MADDAPDSPISRLLNPWGLAPRGLALYCVLILLLAIFTFDRLAAWSILPSADSTEIVLVSSRTCPHSRAVRERLQGAGIPFREIVHGEDPIRSALAVWALQSARVPIVLIGPKIVYGNRREEIDAALVALGYPVFPVPPPDPPVAAADKSGT